VTGNTLDIDAEEYEEGEDNEYRKYLDDGLVDVNDHEEDEKDSEMEDDSEYYYDDMEY